MSHNPHTTATTLDVLTAATILCFFAFVVVMIVGPVRVLAKARDAMRADHVRMITAAALQLEAEDPQTFDGLVERLRSAGDLKVMIGEGDCSGSHGKQCGDFETSNACLALREHIDQELLPELPVDPDRGRFSADLPGYYLSIVDDQLEIGSCGAVTREVFLEHGL